MQIDKTFFAANGALTMLLILSMLGCADEPPAPQPVTPPPTATALPDRDSSHYVEPVAVTEPEAVPEVVAELPAETVMPPQLVSPPARPNGAVDALPVYQSLMHAPLAEWSVQRLPDRSVLLVPPVQSAPMPDELVIQLQNALQITGWMVMQPAEGHLFLWVPQP